MNKRIGIGVAKGRVTAPPSKSYAHRLLIASALSGGECTVSNVGFSQDIKATLDVLEGLGFKFDTSFGSCRSTCSQSHPACDDIVLPCGESASTLRMLMPIALAQGGRFRFAGSERLFQRGVGEYEKIFNEQGIVFRKGKDWIEVEGRLHGGCFQIDASDSSQYVSGLLFALPLLDQDSMLQLTGKVESRPYIDMTLDVLRQFGIVIHFQPGSGPLTMCIPGHQHYTPTDTTVEGDYSNAAFFSALNLLGGCVEVIGLNTHSLQGDKMYSLYFEQLAKGFAHIDISDCIDLGPILFTMAAALHGGVFTGTRRLVVKESDRIGDLLKELSKFGVTFVVSDNCVKIESSPLHAPEVPLDGHGDHRIVMALSVLLTRYGGVIQGAEAVNKSFPSFFDCLEQLGISVTTV